MTVVHKILYDWITVFFRLIAPENAKIVVKWYGFVLDGCHQGNNLRIVDGPKSVSCLNCECWLANVFFTKLQRPIEPSHSRDRINPN